MVNVIEYIFPPDRDELKLALDRVFKFVINKEKKPGNEEGRETKLVFFDLDTGQKEIREYFEPKLFKGKIDAYHVLLTPHNPPLNNDHRDYVKIKLFLDYLDKDQLGRKISYFDCVKQLSNLLNRKKSQKRSYRSTRRMFYQAAKTIFPSFPLSIGPEETIIRVKHKQLGSSDPQEILFQSNQGNEMGSDLNDHKMLRSLEQSLQEFFPKYYSKNSETLQLDDEKHPLNIVYVNRFVTLCRDMGDNIVEDVFNWKNKKPGIYQKIKVLIIDDNYEPFKNQITVIEKHTKLKFFRLENEKSWKELYDSLSSYNQARAEDTTNLFVDFWRRNSVEVNQIAQKRKQDFTKLKRKINSIKIEPMSGIRHSNYLFLEKFDFFLIDLQFDQHKIGDRMVRYLKRLLEDHGKRSPILILSLSDDSMDIQRCLNEGAKGYIYKERIFSIPYRLKELYEKKTPSPSASHSQNFRSLYQLPHPMIDRLKGEQVKGKDGDKKWIDCLPKADLHVHLGGSMPADLIADLAFNHLLSMVYQKVEPAKGKPFDANEIDKALEEIKIKEVLAKINEHIQFPEKQLHSVDKRVVEEIKWIIEEIENQEETTMPFPNRKICDVAGNTSPLKKFLNSEEFGIGDLTWDHKLCIFLVSLAYKDGYDPSRRWRKDGFYYDLIKQVVIKHYLTEKNIYQYNKNKKGKIEQSFNNYLENKFDKILIGIKNMFNGIGIGRKRDNPVYDVYDPYHRDDQKCCCRLIGKILDAGNKDSSLIGYLRGCEISGAQLLRSFENIIIATFRIGLEGSLNRIRYMELRCSPDGFVLPHTRKEIENSSLKFFISEELDKFIFNVKKPESDKEEYSVELRRKEGRYYQVLDALLWGFGNEFQYLSIQMAFKLLSQGMEEKNKKEMKKNFVAPKIAILISAKRHKDLGKIKDQIQMYKMYKKYFSERTEYAPILGFDLAGAEEGYPPTVFSDVMTPLFEGCTNMTIHAGEETDWLYIWQSIYKLHAARIGHGLTLGKDLDLLQLAKERKICIEMCPRSNTLTNEYSEDFLGDFCSNSTNYEQLLETTRNDIRWHGCLRKETYEGIRKILFSEKRSKEPPPYPLKFYYDFGLPVAICTDNPCVSNASMTDEYMEACQRSGGFSKWDILRIIKIGFKNAFLPKEEVARMLQRIGNEIYDKVLELEKIERPYRPSAG